MNNELEIQSAIFLFAWIINLKPLVASNFERETRRNHGNKENRLISFPFSEKKKTI